MPMKRWQIAVIACVAASCAAASVLRGPEIARGLRLGPPRMIEAEVRLINHCELRDSHFELRVPATGERHVFHGGVVHLAIMEGTDVQLRLNSRFPDVEYLGPTRKAQERFEIEAQFEPESGVPWLGDRVRDRFGN